jgi:hypothetical protein
MALSRKRGDSIVAPRWLRQRGSQARKPQKEVQAYTRSTDACAVQAAQPPAASDKYECRTCAEASQISFQEEIYARVEWHDEYAPWRREARLVVRGISLTGTGAPVEKTGIQFCSCGCFGSAINDTVHCVATMCVSSTRVCVGHTEPLLSSL